MARFMQVADGERQKKLYIHREVILERYTDIELYRRFRFDRAGIQVCLEI